MSVLSIYILVRCKEIGDLQQDGNDKRDKEVLLIQPPSSSSKVGLLISMEHGMITPRGGDGNEGKETHLDRNSDHHCEERVPVEPCVVSLRPYIP